VASLLLLHQVIEIQVTALRLKKKPGTHAQGIAADIKVADGAQRMAVVANAVKLGFTGIGVAKSFVHVDIRETTPVLWCY
jgi:uncharacterized protein YcbK (DUF882 family)